MLDTVRVDRNSIDRNSIDRNSIDRNSIAAVSTNSTLEEIGQRIRRANIAAGVLCAHIEALGNRAYGAQPECGNDAIGADMPDAAVPAVFYALDDLDRTLAALDAATKRIIKLA